MEGLLSAYVERKKWEAELFGLAVVRTYIDAVSGRRKQWVSADALLASQGVIIEDGRKTG